MPVYALTKEQAIALAAQKGLRGEGVGLTAIDYNWGPPVSGRFDSDWMHVWACWAGDPESGSMHLQGTQWDDDWALDSLFEIVGTVLHRRMSSALTLFHLDLKGPFPTEFVLRFDHSDGRRLYDNNGNDNYAIPVRVGYWGRGLSALATEDAIWDFGRIVPCTQYWPDTDYGQGQDQETKAQ